MKKRVLSMCMAFVLGFSMMPMTAFAEGTDAVIEQEVQSVENIVNVSGVEDETEAGGGSDEADTESTTDASASSVQDMIDALPDVDALSAMKEDERNTAYMAVQEAYDAYDALTAEQQAQITGVDCFEELFDWFNGQIAPLATGSGEVEYGIVDTKTGKREPWSVTRNGYQIVDAEMTVWTVQTDGFYVLKDSDVTLSSLTIQGGRPAYLYLGENTTLTINNSLTFRDGSMLIVYGAPNGSGKIIINNTADSNSAAIQTDGVSNGSYLSVCSGQLEITSNSGRITDGVYLDNGTGSYHYMEYKIDGKPVVYTENKDILNGKTIAGTNLTLTWCEHSDATYVSDGDTQHKINCAQCGFVGDAVACNFSATNGYASGGEAGHYVKCICGNVDKSHPIAHETGSYLLTDSNHMHISGCKVCGYTGSAGEQHTYENGKCTVCGFEPVAAGDYTYIFGSVKDALDAVANGDTSYIELYSYQNGKTEITENVVFDYLGKTAELRMNGFTLTNATTDPTLSVKSGKLKITGTATINHTGDVSSAAIAVSSGELEFDGDLELNGGLTLTGDATLTNKLTKGTFRASDGTNVARVSVAGSSVYNNVYDLLADGYGFYDSAAKEFVGGGNEVVALTQDVTIKEHTHDYQPVAGSDNYQCACGRTCSHSEGYHNDGKCSVCGKPCPHAKVIESATGYICEDCDKQMLVKIEKGGSCAYSTDFVSAMSGAEDGTKITLLADVQNSGKSAGISGNSKTVTLDLNGHKIIDGWIEVGGQDDNKDYTSCTLKIIGNGSYEKTGNSGNVSVQMKATLNLSDWIGGTISEIDIIDNSGYDLGNREAGLVIGPNAGTIQTLMFGNNQLPAITKIKLSGGSYDNIWEVGHNAIQLGNLLAAGYAFKNADGTYVDYTQKLAGSTINNVKVVKCPHDKIEDGTCAYCGMTGIKATLAGETYTDLDKAVIAWLSNGGELKLFDNYANNTINFSGTSSSLIIDLNGHNFNNGNSMSLNGANLTIRDTVEKYSSGQFGELTADRGTLVLESGTLEVLNIPESSTAAIFLRGGKFKAGTIAVPTYKILESGCYLKNSGFSVNPITKLTMGKWYIVEKTDIAMSGATEGEIAVSKYQVPIAATVKVNDDSIKKVMFTWYLVEANGTTAELGKSNDVTLTNGMATYDVTTNCFDYAEKGWKNIEKNKNYDLICVVIGKKADGSIQQYTAWQGYTMYTLAPSLENAEITFNGGNILTFQPDSDDNSTGRTQKVDFIVKIGEKALVADTDYTVVANSDSATEAGSYTLTIQGDSTNYSGTQTAEWKIVPYKLTSITFRGGVVKQYDGTDTFPEGTVLNKFSSSLTGYTDYIQLKEGTDYVVTEAHFTNPDASENAKNFVVKTRLLNQNYIFDDGTKENTFPLDRCPQLLIKVRKADAPTPETGTLNVRNNRGYSYMVDLTALLPALSSPMEYGETTYIISGIDLGDYYDATKGKAVIENNRLILPIQTVTTREEGTIGTVTVTVRSTNIQDVIMTINVSAVNKIVPVGTPNFSKTELTYSDLLSAITMSGTMTDPTTNETVTGTFQWDTPDKRMDAVGTYEAAWKFVPDNTDTYAEVTGTVTITVIKATLTGEPDYTVITAGGKKLSDAALQANDTWPAGTLEWVDGAGNVLSGDTEVRANTVYKWRFTPADTNYNILTGEITLYPVYSIIDGANSSWTQNANGSLTIRGNGAFSKFVNVKVDGTIVDPVNYTVREGSTIIELKADYLKTLSEGSHAFEIAWTDGTASTSFTVAKNSSDDPKNDDNNKDDNNDNNGDGNSDDGSNNDNSGSNNTAGSADNTVQILTGSPNTGDTLGLWINLFLASAAGLAVMLVRRKKQ